MVDVPENLELTAPQARVLGSLMEKQVTTPDGYPMTLKALTTACNQTTNREPVVEYEPQLVETTLLALKGKGVARVVHPGAGERATKYRQVLDEVFALAPQEHAVLCVLLLRGAQTVSELRSRTDRLHHFSAPPEVEATLRTLADRTPAMVARVERQPGQKEERWIQLLEVDPEGRAAAAATASGGSVSARSGGGAGRIEELEARVAALEERVASLVDQLGDLIDVSEIA